MPPQVNGPGPKGPVVVHSHDGVDQTKSQKKASENQQDTTTPSTPHRTNPKEKEKSQKDSELSLGGSIVKTVLDGIVDAVKGESEQDVKATKGGKDKSNSWLTDLSKALGEMENKQAQKLQKVAKEKISVEQAERLKGTSQELNVMSGAFDSVIKTIGDAINTSAKK